MEKISKRFKELCGIVENEQRKQLKNVLYQGVGKKNLLTEEINSQNFDIIKFDNDGLGKKTTDEEMELYKMQKKDK